LIQVLKKEAKMPIEEMKPLRSKTTRLQAVTPFLESGRVYFVEGEWTESFIKELTSFPYCKHDDRTDAFAWALTHYAMHMDVVDRGIQEAIIQNKRYYGETRREGFSDISVFSEIQTNRRGLFGQDTSYNDPDFVQAEQENDPRSAFAAGRRGRGRGHLGYE
jgi:hypothetical protein